MNLSKLVKIYAYGDDSDSRYGDYNAAVKLAKAVKSLQMQLKILRADFKKLHDPGFRHGDRVRFKKPGPDRSKRIGWIKGHPRAGSKTAYVSWPDGWAGHVRLDELKKVGDDEE